MSGGWLFPRRRTVGGEGDLMSGPWCLVVHTTEIPQHEFSPDPSNDWVSRWGSPSHVVADPYRRRVVQCVDLDRSAKSLYNAVGGVETNRAGALQVEIHMNAVDGANPARPDLDDDQYRWLAAEVFAPICRWAAGQGHPIDLGDVPPPGPIPNSARVDAPQRMSFVRWDRFVGVCGHRHVPENDHWDAGALDLGRLAVLTAAVLNPEVDDLNSVQADQLATVALLAQQQQTQLAALQVQVADIGRRVDWLAGYLVDVHKSDKGDWLAVAPGTPAKPGWSVVLRSQPGLFAHAIEAATAVRPDGSGRTIVDRIVAEVVAAMQPAATTSGSSMRWDAP